MTTFDEGGLTFNPSFVSEIDDGQPNYLGRPCPQSVIITGEDDNRYYVIGGVKGVGGNADELFIANADTGAEAITMTKAELASDARSTFGDAFMDNQRGNTFSGIVGSCAFTVADTPYIIVIVGGQSGVKISKGILYYKINSSSQLELVGGYSGQYDGLNTQFRPDDAFGDSAYGVGHIMTTSFKYTGDVNEIGYQYPIAVCLYGESQSTVFVIPSINQIISEGTLIENVDNFWEKKELFLSATYGASIFGLADSPPSTERSRSFFLPRAEGVGSYMCQQFYLTDLEAHAAGTESGTNSYLDTYASTYVTGLISATQISLGVDLGSPFGFQSALGATNVPFHVKFLNENQSPAFPYPDSKEDYDGNAGTAEDNYYCNGTVLPYDVTDPDDVWFIFIPRVYRESGQHDKIGLRVFAWTPGTEKAKFIDFKKGAIVSIGSETTAGIEIAAANVQWNRDTGALTLLMNTVRSGGSGYVVADFGTFSPIIATPSTDTISETLKVRSWAFTQDHHPFYVLRLGETRTLIYDKKTKQWSEWSTQGQLTWNAEHGVEDWEGFPIAADQTGPFLWKIDPEATLDEDANPITRYVSGIVPHRERSNLPVGEVRIIASVGAPDVGDAQINLRFSDDQGRNYTPYWSISLENDNPEQVLSFRSLGQIKSPGRVFEVQDVGGLVRISGMDIEVG